ncbi:MAG: hypothetical protein NC390_08655 [Fusobacterium sp.]|nr:hypothetical protein [Fusobacterium sp.]
MAEILLSLTIIGVVAAITLPSLTGNINERTWNTQRKALYARMSQAISLMPALNGYGSTAENMAETFVTAGLSKVLKMNNICSYDKLGDCGLPDKIVPYSGSTISPFPDRLSGLHSAMTSMDFSNSGVSRSYTQLDTYAAAFETANGESIAVYYKPDCTASMNENDWHYVQDKMCVNMIYDLNGSKGPNSYGKDIGFISIFYPSDSVIVAPFVVPQDAGQAPIKTTSEGTLSASKKCTEQDSEYRMPNLEELYAIYINQRLIGGNIAGGSGAYWSSSLRDSQYGWYLSMPTGGANIHSLTDPLYVRCVKR